MYQFENKLKEKIYEMIAVVKLFSLLFCGIIILGEYHVWFQNDPNWFINPAIPAIITCIGALVLAYKAWIFEYNNDKLSEGPEIADFIEVVVFMYFFSLLIMLTGAHESPYKSLFLFISITTTMRFGMNYGLIVAFISSGFLLSVDYMALPANKVNQFFEADLILSGIFILTTWFLGCYANIEKEYKHEMAILANSDELTGVYNHRYFQETLSRELEISEKINFPVALLLIDIDYFKNYNDLYGHQAGDQALEKIGKLLKNVIRNKDIVARYGGEEFAIILPNTTEEQAISIAERVRTTIECTSFEGEENLPKGSLTVSVGVSVFPAKAKTKTELINSSDDALYRAKFFNKNRVEIYTSILEELKKDIQDEHIDTISSIKTLISVINAKDRYTYGHTERVVIYCKMIANKLGLTQKEEKILKYGAYLHDIGKIEISKEILNKKMPLTEEEWNMLKKHPECGVEIIKSVDSLNDVVPLILNHHERYDGNGYPQGLKGEDIPYLTRILTIADSFDAMTSNRPYRDRKSYEEAVEELKRCSAIHFDPYLVKVFVEMIEANKDSEENFRSV
ncbi:diguanylate cyclase [Geosporobacter ferrireducens]|uniref:Diguanylate cyclase n=1 Tax=Geosporobacter ferrireducens TaxID=1424294 RepID=A0A1D8GDM8_9FIRM|nr:diguanylate cyclase [Geosporobacter ferrireducens]AOT69018.1 diguanylate cyclase [Geosporobacter ferrireducens]MTI56687.1 diguanylate cyclase [Geosporobacter ferrireducens]